jgi:COP9 signalosome complex subunit 6
LNPTVKTVHKDRKLDLVGWFTILPKFGPSPSVLPTHLGLLELNDSVLLLAFHPDEATHHSAGAKLPLSVYESNYEVDEVTKVEGDGSGKPPEAGGSAQQDEDKTMEDGDAGLKLKFRELPYTVEAEESEMISMDFVAKGGGNATAVESKQPSKPAAAGPGTGTSPETAEKPSKRAKTGSGSPEANTDTESKVPELALSREEEEMISSLTAKANAIRMLQSRINVITKYLEQLPDVKTEMTDADAPTAAPSTTILRQIQALVSRLELLVPSDGEAFKAEVLREQNDVNLVSILNDLVQSTVSARETLRKFIVVEMGKQVAKSKPMGPLFADERRWDSMTDAFL